MTSEKGSGAHGTFKYLQELFNGQIVEGCVAFGILGEDPSGNIRFVALDSDGKVQTVGGAGGMDINVNQVGGLDVTSPDSAEGVLPVEPRQTDRSENEVNSNLKVQDADVADGNPVPVSDAGSSITVDGTVSIQEPLSVDDNGGSLTVDDGGVPLSIDGQINVNEVGGVSVQSADSSLGILPVEIQHEASPVSDSNELPVLILQQTPDDCQITAFIRDTDSPFQENNPLDVTGDRTDGLWDTNEKIPAQYASFDVSTSSTDHVIVEAVTAKAIRVLSYTIIAEDATGVQWKSSPTGTGTTGESLLSGVMQLADNGGIHAGYCPVGHFQTAEDEDLVLELDTASAVAGHITYIEVDIA